MKKQCFTALFLGFSALCFSQTSSEIKEGVVVGTLNLENSIDGSSNYMYYIQDVQTGIILESLPTQAQSAIGENTPFEKVLTTEGEKANTFDGKNNLVIFHR